MRHDHAIAVIIPVLNEESSIALVLDAIPDWVDDIVVVDNGSTDNTASVAESHGARVVVEPQRGYGAACLRGMDALNAPDIVVFLDGDFSDHPEEMPLLVDPILEGEVDMMIGSRVRGTRERGALTPQAHFGNWLATRLIRAFWGIRYTDLGPFRAIRYRSLLQLAMVDQDYGWTVEMQIKAALRGVPADEVPVSYRKRVGVSKVSGTIRGVIGAGYKILSTIFMAALLSRPVMKTGLLVFFTRFPEPGMTKTRLIPALGPDGAAALQREMTEHCLSVAPPVRQDIDTCVCYTGSERNAMMHWLGATHDYQAQASGDLGARMVAAFDQAFMAAYGKVLIAGSDCPDLDSTITAAAFDALDTHDLVLGPAVDGGYYLIGMNIASVPEELDAFFEDMAWGTDTVLEATRRRAHALGWRIHELPTLSDVDYPEDLPVWEAAKEKYHLSIVVPVLNEAERIGALLAALQPVPNSEILVVDGGSSDSTVKILQDYGVTVLKSNAGRAYQLNAGAARARGPLLLFLHADTTLPNDTADWVRRVLASDALTLGAFELRIDGPGFLFRWLEWTAKLRSRTLRVPYGDQGFFMRQSTFDSVGGFPELPILEDYQLVRNLKKAGGQIITVPARVRTSSRRWDHEGKLRLTAKNVTTFFLYPLGISAQRFARWYHRNRNT